MIIRTAQPLRSSLRRQCCNQISRRRYTSTPKVPDTRSPRPTVVQPPPSSSNSTAPRKLNVYRDVWPPVLSCLGIGLVVYYGLELWRTNLDYKYRVQDMAIEIESLKAQVETLREENERSSSLPSKVLGRRTSGLGSESERQSSKKWFGLF